MRYILKKLFGKYIREELSMAYNLGISKGYELRIMMAESEITNRGFIIGPPDIQKELDEILKGSRHDT